MNRCYTVHQTNTNRETASHGQTLRYQSGQNTLTAKLWQRDRLYTPCIPHKMWRHSGSQKHGRHTLCMGHTTGVCCWSLQPVAPYPHLEVKNVTLMFKLPAALSTNLGVVITATILTAVGVCTSQAKDHNNHYPLFGVHSKIWKYFAHTNKQRELIALNRQGTRQLTSASPMVAQPGVPVNTSYINSTKGTCPSS